MLIWARIVLGFLLIMAVINIGMSGLAVVDGSVFIGVFGIMFSALFAWLAYTNYVDVAQCVTNASDADFLEKMKKLNA